MMQKLKFMRKHKIIVAVILAGLLGLGIFGSVTSFAGGREKRTVQKQGWSYTLDIQDGSISDITVNYNYTTVKGIAAYATAQRQANQELYKSGVPVVEAAEITFNHPLTLEQADAFVKQYGFIAHSYEFDVVENSTVGGNPSPPGILALGLIRNGKTLEGFDAQSRQSLLQQMQQMQQDISASTINSGGIIGMQVALDYPEYQQVNADKNVYLIEMNRQILKLELKNKADQQLNGIDTSKINLNDLNFDDLNVSFIAGPLYRNLQKVGIAPPELNLGILAD